LQLYQAAEKEQDGTGVYAVMDFIADKFPGYSNPDGSTSSHSDMHGFATAVQALDSFEKEATALGMDGNIQLAILPNDGDRADKDFLQTYDPGNDPRLPKDRRLRKDRRLPADAVVAGWSISMGTRNQGFTQFVERQIADGYPVFAGAGNHIWDREMTVFISPKHVIGVGGNSCQGDNKAEFVTSEHTDGSVVDPYGKDGDCQTIAPGTSATTPAIATISLVRAVQDFQDDGKLNGTTIPKGFTPQLTYYEADPDETLSPPAPRTSNHEASRSPPR